MSPTQSLLAAGILAGLTLQAMILFAIVGVAEELFVKRSRKTLQGFQIPPQGK